MSPTYFEFCDAPIYITFACCPMLFVELPTPDYTDATETAASDLTLQMPVIISFDDWHGKSVTDTAAVDDMLGKSVVLIFVLMALKLCSCRFVETDCL